LVSKLYKKGNNMLTVTEIAKEKLKEYLQSKTNDPEMAIRLVTSPSGPKRFTFVLDKEKKGDKVVEGNAGEKVLLIRPILFSEIEGLVVDYQERAQSSAFTISTPDSRIL
jgi:Fe-S cluster assembly iron-binding protein IscA